jgi:hypothetical protein
LNPRYYLFILNGGIAAPEVVVVIDETIKWTLSKKLTSRQRHRDTHTKEDREWMGRDLNSRPPVCKTGILTRLDYPSGKTARQLSGSILIVFGVAIIVRTLARGAIIIAAKRTSFFQTTMGKVY